MMMTNFYLFMENTSVCEDIHVENVGYYKEKDTLLILHGPYLLGNKTTYRLNVQANMDTHGTTHLETHSLYRQERKRCKQRIIL